MAKLKSILASGRKVIGRSFKKTTKKKGGGRLKVKTGFLSSGLPKSKGRGRPFGSYKYGRPISQVKKIQSLRSAVADMQREKQAKRLMRAGYSVEQIEDIRRDRAVNEPLALSRSAADEEIALKKALAQETVSANTQRIIDDIRRIQNKGKSDDISQQRRNKEKMIVGKHMNLMEAHKNMNKVTLDFTGVNDDENILMAKNLFKENQEDHVLRQNRPHVLQTKETGNNLRFGAE